MDELTLEDGICAGIFIILGLLSVIIGYRVYRATFLIAGAYFGYILMYPVLIGAGVHPETTVFGVSLAVGVLLGLLMMVVWEFGLFVCGTIAGYILATYIIGFCHGTVLDASPGCYIFTAACCIIFGLFAVFFFKRIVLIVTTSVLGAYFFFYGVDVYLVGRTGFAYTFDGVLSFRESPLAGFTSSTWGMVWGSIGLAAVGVIFQLLVTGRPDFFAGKGSTCSCCECGRSSPRAPSPSQKEVN